MAVPFSDQTSATLGTALLLGAAVLVGGSILSGGLTGMVLNGLGGIAWLSSSIVLVAAARRARDRGRLWVLTVGLTIVVAFLVRPSDVWLALAGFGTSGALLGAASRERPILWATLVPALYLPAHIGAALLMVWLRKMLEVESSVRTEPPPVAAVVPMVMVLGSIFIAGGTAWIRRRYAPRSLTFRYTVLPTKG